MDVDCYSFQTLLPSILAAISSSRFVSVDLELSGIPSRHRIRGRRSECNAGGKATLQQRYTEIKAAAERFQILQLGLTCVEEVDKEGEDRFSTNRLSLVMIVIEDRSIYHTAI